MSDDRDSRPGFRPLTTENWLTADPAGEAFIEPDLATGERRQMRGSGWSGSSRRSGDEQLHGVADAATLHRIGK